MASRVTTTLIDDLDGTPADETVAFALDGVAYEIDLTAEHAQQLRDAFSPFLHEARKTVGLGRPALHRVEVAPDPRAVKSWARARGIALPPRGKVPAEVLEAYRAAGN